MNFPYPVPEGLAFTVVAAIGLGLVFRRRPVSTEERNRASAEMQAREVMIFGDPLCIIGEASEAIAAGEAVIVAGGVVYPAGRRYSVPREARADGKWRITFGPHPFDIIERGYARRSSALRAARRLNAKAAGQ